MGSYFLSGTKVSVRINSQNYFKKIAKIEELPHPNYNVKWVGQVGMSGRSSGQVMWKVSRVCQVEGSPLFPQLWGELLIFLADQ